MKIIAIVAVLITLGSCILFYGISIKPYVHVEIINAAMVKNGYECSYKYTRSSNIEICDIIYKDGVETESGGSMGYTDGLLARSLGNIRSSHGSSSSGMHSSDNVDVLLHVKTGDVVSLKQGDTMDIVTIKSKDGTIERRSIRIYSLNGYGRRLESIK